MNINFSICITYFYKRNNINQLLDQFKNKNLKDLEILIYNDNSQVDLKINSELNIKVYQNTSKPIGEFESIKFLLKKANGRYISIIADDDLISSKMILAVKKDNFKNIAYISQTTKSKNYFESLKTTKNEDYKKKLINFFKGEIYISGTISAVYEKNFIIKLFSDIESLKYLIDTFVLIKLIDQKCLFFDDYFGYNNTLSSKISSHKIDTRSFIDDYFVVMKQINDTEVLKYFVSYILNNFYSIIHRENKNRINLFVNFCYLNLKSILIPKHIKIYILMNSFFYFVKLFVKNIKFYFNKKS